MRKLVAVITVGTVLVAAPSASAQPDQGCRAFGEAVAGAAKFGQVFGQGISSSAKAGGNPLGATRQFYC